MNSNIREIIKQYQYEFVRYLNAGGFGSCYIVKSLKYNMEFVCKASMGICLNEMYLASFKREADILIKLNHPNIVRIYDFFIESKILFIILEYCSNGSLLSLLRERGKLDEETALKCATEIIDALNFMHSKGIAHCDIKLSNILIDQFQRVKLCDFGLSRIIKNKPEDNKSDSKKVVGTVNYMAPEILIGMEYDSYKADVWALGVTLYTMLCGNFPFNGKDMNSVIKEIKMGYGKLEDDSPISQIINMCLEIEPEVRPTMQQLKLKLMEFYKPRISSKPKSSSKIFSHVAQHSIISSQRLRRMSTSALY